MSSMLPDGIAIAGIRPKAEGDDISSHYVEPLPGSNNTAATKGADEEFTPEEFFNAVRYGSKSHISFILNKDNSFIHKFDSQGFSCMHWAAKRGEYEILHELTKLGADISSTASFETRMLPIHWAASDGKTSSLQFLLDHNQDINAQDANGCTPLIIAVQYGQVYAAVYLIKNGADLAHRDNNGDTALHWAAYKGFEELAGLLMHFVPEQLNQEDVYGQVPLHLAALRGNKDVVRYLCAEWGADVGKRDKNGFTPMELAIKKKQLYAEWEIRRQNSSTTLTLALRLGLDRFKDGRVIKFLLFAFTEKESTAWIWRVALLSNLIASSISLWYATSSVLAGFWPLHIINSIIQITWWVLFTINLWCPPAFVDQQSPEYYERNLGTRAGSKGSGPRQSKAASEGRTRGGPGGSVVAVSGEQAFHPRSYDAALEIIGKSPFSNPAELPQVCHTCRLQKPLRSKHCKIQHKCVAKFDHFCPYVFNSVSRDNYKYFCSIIVMHHFAYGGFALATLCYWWFEPISIWLILFLVYSTGMVLAISSLGGYHAGLLVKNMTTNEDINAFRYHYFRNEFNLFHNPFDKGSPRDNFWDGIFPSRKLYYSRREVMEDRLKESRGEKISETDSDGGWSKAAVAAASAGAGAGVGSRSMGSGGQGGASEEAEGFFEEARRTGGSIMV